MDNQNPTIPTQSFDLTKFDFLKNPTVKDFVDSTTPARAFADGIHTISSVKSILSKKGNPTVEIDLVHKHLANTGIKDFLQTSSFEDHSKSMTRISYLMSHLGVQLALESPFDDIFVTADGTECTADTPGASPLIVVNYDKDSFDELRARYGDNIDTVRTSPEQRQTPDFRAWLVSKGLIAEDEVVNNCSRIVRVNKQKAVAYCDAIAQAFQTSIGKTVDIKTSPKPNSAYGNVSMYMVKK
jgi:hypothetical protein